MAQSDSVESKNYFRVIDFGFPNKPPLNAEEIQDLFEPVLDKRPFICVSHDPLATPELRPDYDIFHYHILTRRSVCETFWNDQFWNRFFENIEQSNGWVRVMLCSNVNEKLAAYKMPGIEVSINRMDPVLLKSWNSIKEEEINDQIMKQKVLFMKMDDVKMADL